MIPRGPFQHLPFCDSRCPPGKPCVVWTDPGQASLQTCAALRCGSQGLGRGKENLMKLWSAGFKGPLTAVGRYCVKSSLISKVLRCLKADAEKQFLLLHKGRMERISRGWRPEVIEFLEFEVSAAVREAWIMIPLYLLSWVLNCWLCDAG